MHAYSARHSVRVRSRRRRRANGWLSGHDGQPRRDAGTAGRDHQSQRLSAGRDRLRICPDDGDLAGHRRPRGRPASLQCRAGSDVAISSPRLHAAARQFAGPGPECGGQGGSGCHAGTNQVSRTVGPAPAGVDGAARSIRRPPVCRRRQRPPPRRPRTRTDPPRAAPPASLLPPGGRPRPPWAPPGPGHYTNRFWTRRRASCVQAAGCSPPLLSPPAWPWRRAALYAPAAGAVVEGLRWRSLTRRRATRSTRRDQPAPGRRQRTFRRCRRRTPPALDRKPAASSAESPGPKSRRVEAITAQVLLALGVLLAGFLLFVFVLSGLTEGRAQAGLERRFKTPLVNGQAPVAARIRYGTPVARLDIPAAGIHQIVVQGTSPPELERGPGHVAVTPLPGEVGNAVIAGHRIAFGGPFSGLSRLAKGARIDVLTGQGHFTYVVARPASAAGPRRRALPGHLRQPPDPGHGRQSRRDQPAGRGGRVARAGQAVRPRPADHPGRRRWRSRRSVQRPWRPDLLVAWRSSPWRLSPCWRTGACRDGPAIWRPRRSSSWWPGWSTRTWPGSCRPRSDFGWRRRGTVGAVTPPPRRRPRPDCRSRAAGWPGLP